MPTELNLLFSTPEKVTVSLRSEYDDDQTDNLSCPGYNALRCNPAWTLCVPK